MGIEHPVSMKRKYPYYVKKKLRGDKAFGFVTR